MADPTQPMPAQLVIPSGWAVLRGDKEVRAGDRYIDIEDGKARWWPIVVGGFKAARFGIVIFQLKGRNQGRRANRKSKTGDRKS